MGARDVIRHLLALVGLAQVRETGAAPPQANITIYDSRR